MRREARKPVEKIVSIDKIDSLSTHKDSMLDEIEIHAEFCLILVYPNLSFLLWSYDRNAALLCINITYANM